jgi:hypothetical protein
MFVFFLFVYQSLACGLLLRYYFFRAIAYATEKTKGTVVKLIGGLVRENTEQN